MPAVKGEWGHGTTGHHLAIHDSRGSLALGDSMKNAICSRRWRAIRTAARISLGVTKGRIWGDESDCNWLMAPGGYRR